MAQVPCSRIRYEVCKQENFVRTSWLTYIMDSVPGMHIYIYVYVYIMTSMYDIEIHQ